MTIFIGHATFFLCKRLPIHKQYYALYKSVDEIIQATGLGYHSVSGYLPYTKTIYKLSELSSEATRLRRCRYRKNLCNNFTNAIQGMSEEEEEEYLLKHYQRLQGGNSTQQEKEALSSLIL